MSVNYILHLNKFYQRISNDDRIKPGHISLYHALFQLWNREYFKNPFFIQRTHVMRLCKIESRTTYQKYMQELDKWGYIQYNPSYNYYQGSEVRIMQFYQDEPVQNLDNTCSENEQDMSNLCSSHVQNMGTYMYINNKTINSFLNAEKNQNYISNYIFTPPTLEQVIDFFISKKCNQSAANSFFNYYECCGWKISGKTTMVNWQAAAQNWINNVPKTTKPFSQHQGHVDNLNAPTKDNYSEPL